MGPATEDGAISLRDLVDLAGNIQSGIDRVARLLSGRAGRTMRKPPRDIAAACTLRLAALERGSVGLVVRRAFYGQFSFEEMDIGMQAIERFIEGLAEIASDTPELPEGYDTGVLDKWRTIGQLLNRGVDRIELALDARSKRVTSTLDITVRTRIAQRIQASFANMRVIDGLLRMADFKEDDMKCRLYPAEGDSILCEFDEDLAATVHAYLRRWVRVRGWAEHDPTSGLIRRLTIHSLEPVSIAAASERKAGPSAREGAPPDASTFEAVLGQGRDLWNDDDEFDAFVRGIYERRREDAER